MVYGPLAEVTGEPSVVLLRLNAKQLMVLFDAVPGLRIEGKPQCHIVAAAHEQGAVVASVGCMLSRVRTGMPDDQLTCALPASRLAEVTASIQRTAAVDATVGAVRQGRFRALLTGSRRNPGREGRPRGAVSYFLAAS